MYDNRYETIQIFAQGELRNFLKVIKRNVIASIESEKDDYLLNVNEEDYVSFKVSEATLEALEIHNDQIYVSSSEKMISAEHFPRSLFSVQRGNSYPKNVIKFHIPFSGNRDLLSCSPSSQLIWSIEVEVNDHEFCFEIIDFSNDADSMIRQRDSNMQKILQQCSNVMVDIEQYNSNLYPEINAAFISRKNEIMRKSNFLASLGVPIKKTSSPSETFSVPVARKRTPVTISKPIVKDSGFKPEPTLDSNIYHEILQVLHDVGKQFERLPSLYANKEEEHLRDHFLMFLETNFEGSATGETFNKTGKTDILLRQEGTNVFIGECKFWRGKKSFLNTITQLLGYLTWRDSKVAVIMFVPNHDFSSVLETAKGCISDHSNYLRLINEQDETWLNHEFHLNGDRNRVVKVAIMLYHIPKGG